MVHSIVDHMNQDHADAIAAMLQAFGESADGAAIGAVEASEVRITGISPEVMTVEFGETGSTRAATIEFRPPIDPPESVRARLVTMTREARQVLQGQPRSGD